MSKKIYIALGATYGQCAVQLLSMTLVYRNPKTTSYNCIRDIGRIYNPNL